ncbi:MAG: 50S ribosomal protein L18 [Campylobacteraceae bacterium]|jgi:large subunit ribosomal protein L18|nr:50S ribosomal protein L18 [Campylobacteraceae bacterium]
MREKVLENKLKLRAKRKRRIRAKISGTQDFPRVSVFRSNRYFYAQAIDDINGVTLASVDSKKLSLKANTKDAAELAKTFSQTLKDKGIEKAVFDRNGYLYHGVVAAFAQALRDNGIAL